MNSEDIEYLLVNDDFPTPVIPTKSMLKVLGTADISPLRRCLISYASGNNSSSL